jgi:hypothetical protein
MRAGCTHLSFSWDAKTDSDRPARYRSIRFRAGTPPPAPQEIWKIAHLQASLLRV